MRDDEPVIDLDLTVEGLDADGEPSRADDPRISRRARLLAWVRRPWPRPLIVVVTAVVAIAFTSWIRLPDPGSETASEEPSSDAVHQDVPMYTLPGDGSMVVDDEFLLNGSGEWVATGPAGELLVEASDKLGAPDADPVFHGTGLGVSTRSGPSSQMLPAGEYVLEIACAASVQDVSMRLEIVATDSWNSDVDVPCDGPMASIGIALTETTAVSLASVGPNAVHIGYSFRIIPAER